MKPLRKWPIIRTILGKNSAGKKLNQILPLKSQREALSQVVRGVADVAPVPNAKDATIREKVEKIKAITQDAQALNTTTKAADAIKTINDLLDDGQLNDSYTLSPEVRKKIRLASAVFTWLLIVYEVVAVVAGWPSVLTIVSTALA